MLQTRTDKTTKNPEFMRFKCVTLSVLDSQRAVEKPTRRHYFTPPKSHDVTLHGIDLRVPFSVRRIQEGESYITANCRITESNQKYFG